MAVAAVAAVANGLLTLAEAVVAKGLEAGNELPEAAPKVENIEAMMQRLSHTSEEPSAHQGGYPTRWRRCGKKGWLTQSDCERRMAVCFQLEELRNATIALGKLLPLFKRVT